MGNARSTYKVFLFIAVVIFSVINYGCVNELSDIQNLTAYQNVPVNVARDVEIIYSDSGQIKLLLRSPLLNTFEGDDPRVEMPEGLKVFFYNDDMSITSYLTARYAVSYDNRKIMEAKQNVVIVNEKGERLNTEHITWYQNDRKIVSNKFVKITTPDKIMFGDGLESDETFTDWVITRPRGRMYIKNTEE
jgi:LPS export ABC transporter protein LptC